MLTGALLLHCGPVGQTPGGPATCFLRTVLLSASFICISMHVHFQKKKKSIRGACVFGTLQFFSFVAGSRVPSRSAAVISPRNYPLALHVFPRSGNPMCVGVKKSNDVVIAGFLQMASRCAHFSCSRFSQLDTTEILLSHLVVL